MIVLALRPLRQWEFVAGRRVLVTGCRIETNVPTRWIIWSGGGHSRYTRPG